MTAALVGGRFVSYALLAVAVVSISGFDSIKGSDEIRGVGALLYAAGLAALSVGSELLLARPIIELSPGRLTIRNPLKVYRMALFNGCRIEIGEPSFLGRVTLKYEGNRRIVCTGIERTGLTIIRGESQEEILLRLALGSRRYEIDHNQINLPLMYETRVRLMSPALGILLAAWTCFFAFHSLVLV
ncbi:hypothetical protein [Branchiibius hedensis]|uniref:hypothetical protein n=1 Tax=Branchiibius hedensis TaxID=672460 RepID=UPI0011B27534|nr:hypothetical protein [Branchiibius hedensis]